MVEADVGKTSYVCHNGKLEFLRMRFGVSNAPAVFQALITKILTESKLFASLYMDDVIVYSEIWEEHKTHVRHVLECLR